MENIVSYHLKQGGIRLEYASKMHFIIQIDDC